MLDKKKVLVDCSNSIKLISEQISPSSFNKSNLNFQKESTSSLFKTTISFILHLISIQDIATNPPSQRKGL